MKGIVSTIIFIVISSLTALASDNRGLQVITIQDQLGQDIELYASSHALIIGVSEYSEGWPNLPGVQDDLLALQQKLETSGFQVVIVENPDYMQLDQAIRDFISQYGEQAENRLLFYFAGHGHTERLSTGVEMGYIVPADAPNPHRDPSGFRTKAMDMQMFESYAKRIQAKHALFLFDSCFSGSIFDLSRAIPENITYKTAQPVRQFITSGSAGEQVPDRSIFRQQFVAALDGEGDITGDGYVTGAELGEFLQTSVVNYSKGTQHPQYGKIRDPRLDKGDFIFVLPGALYIEDVHVKSGNEQALDPEGEMWELVKNSSDIADIQAFLEAFPNGRLVQVARLKQEQLERKQSQEPSDVVKKTKSQVGHIMGDVWKEPVTGMEFVWIEGGCFQMGQTEVEKQALMEEMGEKGYNFWYRDHGVFPLHHVCVDGFWIGKYEVTNAQYRLWNIEHDSGNVDGLTMNGRNQPVSQISWEEANAFAEWLTNQHNTAYTFRLPTEAEWEYAARAGTKTLYFWGDDLNNICEYANIGDQTTDRLWPNRKDIEYYECNDGYAVTSPVGSFKPNPFGLYDIIGNVMELCQDWYDPLYYAESPLKNPKGPLSGKERVVRGSSWAYYPFLCRASARGKSDPTEKGAFKGFRVVRIP